MWSEIWVEIKGMAREAFMRGVHKLFDRKNGTEYEVREKRNRAAGYDDHFTLLFDRGGRRLAAMADLTAMDFRLLLLLVAGEHKLDFVTYRPFAQREIAGWLSTSQSTVSRSMKRLLDREIVERADYRGGGARPSGYRINPDFFWRGTVDQYYSSRRKRQDARPAVPEPEGDGSAATIRDEPEGLL